MRFTTAPRAVPIRTRQLWACAWWERALVWYTGLEGSYQTGKRGGQVAAAYMAGARVGGKLGGGKALITLW